MTKCARCGRALVATEGRTEAVCATCLAPPFKSSVSWLTCLPNADTGAAYKHWKAESGPGIAALDLRPPTRQPTRHKTTSWDPDMPLEDAEPGRYGWRS